VIRVWMVITVWIRFARSLGYDFTNRNGYNHSTGVGMANVKKGNLTSPPQWWKHLRDWKRVFWKSERQAQKKDIKNES